ncbi:MAG: GAF domain-containing protein, partial [Candidatus Eiseniibacteriota bacterium]
MDQKELSSSASHTQARLSRLSPEDVDLVFALTQELDRTWVFEDLVATILSRLKEFLKVERAALFLMGKQSRLFSAFVGPLSSKRRFSTETLPVNDPLPGFLLNSEGLTVAKKDALDESVSRRIEELLGRSFGPVLYAPLSGEEGRFGAFCVFGKPSHDSFSERDFVLLKTAAPVISLALRLSRHKNEFRKSVLQRDMLAEVGRTVVSSFDLESVLNSTLDTLHRILSYDSAAIVLRRPESGEIHSLVTRGLDPKYEQRIRLKADQGLVASAIKTGSGFTIPDTRKDSRYVEARASSRSGMYAPLIVGDRAIGALSLESDRLNTYTQDHLDLLTAFANQVAIMIERTRLHEEVMKTRWIEEELKIAR